MLSTRSVLTDAHPANAKVAIRAIASFFTISLFLWLLIEAPRYHRGLNLYAWLHAYSL